MPSRPVAALRSERAAEFSRIDVVGRKAGSADVNTRDPYTVPVPRSLKAPTPPVLPETAARGVETSKSDTDSDASTDKYWAAEIWKVPDTIRAQKVQAGRT